MDSPGRCGGGASPAARAHSVRNAPHTPQLTHVWPRTRNNHSHTRWHVETTGGITCSPLATAPMARHLRRRHHCSREAHAHTHQYTHASTGPHHSRTLRNSSLAATRRHVKQATARRRRRRHHHGHAPLKLTHGGGRTNAHAHLHHQHGTPPHDHARPLDRASGCMLPPRAGALWNTSTTHTRKHCLDHSTEVVHHLHGHGPSPSCSSPPTAAEAAAAVAQEPHHTPVATNYQRGLSQVYLSREGHARACGMARGGGAVGAGCDLRLVP